ncbi:hypothetical protein ID875_25545 [Streptomyces globisporus]|uniref:Uncharacterized protein n=1 Tax=Streptomyces globisporus TaxID=1908 RepID=A0A927BP84_STRGL|nr:hypothetical protein [Streptomyces globisporus]
MRKTDPGVGCSVLVALDHRASVAVDADLEAGVEALPGSGRVGTSGWGAPLTFKASGSGGT